MAFSKAGGVFWLDDDMSTKHYCIEAGAKEAVHCLFRGINDGLILIKACVQNYWDAA
jgi:hypothetical protein